MTEPPGVRDVGGHLELDISRDAGPGFAQEDLKRSTRNNRYLRQPYVVDTDWFN